MNAWIGDFNQNFYDLFWRNRHNFLLPRKRYAHTIPGNFARNRSRRDNPTENYLYKISQQYMKLTTKMNSLHCMACVVVVHCHGNENYTISPSVVRNNSTRNDMKVNFERISCFNLGHGKTSGFWCNKPFHKINRWNCILNSISK